MKKLLLITTIAFFATPGFAQLGARSFSLSDKAVSDAELTPEYEEVEIVIVEKDGKKQEIRIVKPKQTVKTFNAKAIPTFGLNGLGNTNTETFDNVNASGKLSGYIRPYKGDNGYWEVNFAFNINATNTDSLTVNTVLFPDVGNNSFSATVLYNWIAGGSGNDHYILSPFFEFANKTISGRNDDSERRFYTLNTSFGVNLQYLFFDGKDQVSFGLSPYFATVNVPDPGIEDYRYLFTGDEMAALDTSVKSWGAKATFQYNSFQIFADFRTVLGKKEDFPVSGLTGFHPNLGVVVNAEIFER